MFLQSGCIQLHDNLHFVDYGLCVILKSVYYAGNTPTPQLTTFKIPKILSSPRRPDQWWGPPNLPLNGYRNHYFSANTARA